MGNTWSIVIIYTYNLVNVGKTMSFLPPGNGEFIPPMYLWWWLGDGKHDIVLPHIVFTVMYEIVYYYYNPLYNLWTIGITEDLTCDFSWWHLHQKLDFIRFKGF